MRRMAWHEATASACRDLQIALQVLALLAAGHQNYAPQAGMSAAVEALIASSTTADPALASFRLAASRRIWFVATCTLLLAGDPTDPT